jgi:hypothetical protein
MMIELDSMAVQMPEVEGHPNRVDFRGVLTVVDIPSQRAPGGAKGRRVLLTRKAAEAALPSLIGMALDYSPDFDGHDARRKVGIITSADVVGRNVEVGGYLYAKDFPEIVEEVARCGARSKSAHPAETLPRSSAVVKDAWNEGTRLRASLAQAVKDLRSLVASVEQKTARVRLSLKAEGRSGKGSQLGMSFEATNVDVLDDRAKIWVLNEVTFTGAAILRRDKAAYRDTWIELVR